MRLMYVPEVIHCWVSSNNVIFWSYNETVDMLQLVRAVLYVPPTQTAAESAFSIQKWMLSGRRATRIPANCNLRMVGRSCMRLKRRIDEVKMEMHMKKKQRLS